METDKNYLPGGITQEQLDSWKKSHGKVLVISVEDSEAGTQTGYLKEPDFKVLKRMFSVIRNSVVDAGEVALNNCWLGGDEMIRNSKPNTSTEAKVRAAAALEACSVIDLPTSTSEYLKN